MFPDGTIHGRLGDLDNPYWEPLLELVGLGLADWFMWMGGITLDGAAPLHAYKHIATRRYLHLHEDGGRAFAYAGRDRYREVSLREALDEAFKDWEPTLMPSEDPEPVRAALREAYERADRRASARCGDD